MRLEDITVEIRSVALGRLGQVDLAEIDDLKIIKRFRNVGNWTMSLPADYDGAAQLAQAGRGLVVTGPGDKVLMSGPVTNFRKRETSDDSDGMWYFDGTDDMVHLADGLCFPTPGAAVTAQVDAYDIFASNAEDTLRHYVDVNRGPSAPVSRRVTGLVLEPASLGRGGTVLGRARFDQMGPFLDRLGSSGGVGFDIAQVGAQLQFQVYVPSDRSATVRMDIDNDMLTETEYGFSAPSTTRPVIAGQGEATERLFFQKTSAESLAAEAAWGRKIETFKDRRDTPDPAELEQQADTLLTEGGKTVTSLSVKPADETTMRYAVDWYLGDIVGVIVDGQELTSVVTEAIISIDTDGVRISATIGEPTGFDFESKMIAKTQDQEKRLQTLEKNNGSILDWANIIGKPLTFAPSAHTHPIADVTSLQAELDGKADYAIITAKLGTATPSAYPLGSSMFLTGINDGTWPEGYLTVVTDRVVAGRVGQTAFRATTGQVFTRVDAGSETWSTWREIAAPSQSNQLLVGQVKIIPLSVGGGTIDSNGDIEFTAVTSIDVNNVFPTEFREFEISYSVDTPSATLGGVNLNLRAAGVVANAGNYDLVTMSNAGSTSAMAVSVSTGLTGWFVDGGVSATLHHGVIRLRDPNAAAATRLQFTSYSRRPGAALLSVATRGGVHNLSTIYDGFRLSMPGGCTGVVRVYGIR